jgi:photosystem II stability/assembly factor-like uncharacterized protein
VIYTTNYGTTWTRQDTFVLLEGGGLGTLYALSFVSKTEGWAVGDLGSRILYTANAGTTWQVRISEAITWQVSFGVYFLKGFPPGFSQGVGLGVIVGQGGGIARTDTGGADISFAPSCTTSHLRAVTFVDAGMVSGSSRPVFNL